MRTSLLVALVLLLGCEMPRDSPRACTQSPSSSAGGLYQITEMQAYEIAYASIAGELGYDPPKRPEWKHWGSTLNYEYDGVGGNQLQLVWGISADFSPGGGGTHASARVNAQTGKVLSVNVGRHGR